MIQSIHAHDESRGDRHDADRPCDKRAVLHAGIRHRVMELVLGLVHVVDEVVRGAEAVGRDAAKLPIMHDDLPA